MKKQFLCIAVALMALHSPAWGQAVSGVRGINGGVGALFNLTGPGSLYLDSQGNQGYMYTQGTFESYNFRNQTSGQAWSGGMMTLGAQLSVGLIQGANQGGSSPTVFPPSPRSLPPLPPIESAILEDIP